ncbi:dihydrodipicolinate synthase family protein [Nonomuraea sp. NPDC050310]|uniref:dihydrodipicolinate synthase family protein n=1 Tax=unclassified Nonomuraea TaxID=2593643 RepID=UPI0033E8B1AA
MAVLQGIVTATPTAFTKDGDLDETRFRELVRHLLSEGVHGVSVAGSQGEFAVLDRTERLRLIEIAVEEAAGRVPVYAGTGAISTRESIELTRAAQSIGADVAMIITPYFLSPSPAELASHYRQVAAATDLPVLAYNNPPRTGVNLTGFTPFGNVVGIKDSSGDLTQAVEYLRGGALVFSGRDTITLALLLHGGAGAISPAACVFPRLLVRMYGAAKSGRLEEALAISDALAPLRRAWELGSFPVVIKEAMALTGHDPGPARLPVAPLTEPARAKLAEVVAKIQAFEAELA